MLQKVNLKAAADSVQDLFCYLEIGRLNNHMLNVLQAENRTLEFHIHEDSDELFYVIEGEMQLETNEETVLLKQGELIVVPKGVRHRPVCKALVKCLLIELCGTLTAQNTGGGYQN